MDRNPDLIKATKVFYEKLVLSGGFSGASPDDPDLFVSLIEQILNKLADADAGGSLLAEVKKICEEKIAEKKQKEEKEKEEKEKEEINEITALAIFFTEFQHSDDDVDFENDKKEFIVRVENMICCRSFSQEACSYLKGVYSKLLGEDLPKEELSKKFSHEFSNGYHLSYL